jgi:6-phosphogluconolactonase
MRIVSLHPNELVRLTAEYTCSRLLAALDGKSSVFLLLSAGSWVKIYSSMVPILPTLDMTKLTFGLVDERCVPKGHVDSNEQQISETKLIRKFVDHGATFIPTIQDIQIDPSINAESIDSLFKQILSKKIHFILTLGLGSDGHTAGILPSSTPNVFSSRFNDQKLFVYYQTIPEDTSNPHRKRFTISPTCIEKADEIIIFASGTEKKPIIDRLAHSADPIHAFPAGILRAITDKVTIYTDNA